MHIVFFPHPTHFFNEGKQISKTLGRGAIFKKISRGNQKSEGRGNAKFIGGWGFFSLLTMMVTGYIFREHRLADFL